MTTAIIILLFVCGFLYYQMQQRGKKTAKKEMLSTDAARAYPKDALRIENVGAGGMIHISGIGPEMDEFDVKVIAKHLYREGASSWYELEGESADGAVWIDLEDDDGLTLNITLKKMKLRDIGLSKRDLERMDDDEEGSFTFEGETYYYEDSDRAMFYRYGDETQGESFYYWDFENKAGNKFIGVEKWDDGAYDVSYSEPIASHQVSVFSLKA